jgi:hypothetical protein
LGFRVLGSSGFFGFLSFYGLVWLFLCIQPVYLGAPYAFFNIFLLLTKRKKKKKKLMNEKGMQRKGLRFLSLFSMFEIEFSLFDCIVEEKRKEPICS